MSDGLILSKASDKCTMLILYDSSVAFDTVYHYILMRLLSNFGSRGNVFDWFKIYMQHLDFYVYISAKKSSLADIKTAVPQGSNKAQNFSSFITLNYTLYFKSQVHVVIFLRTNLKYIFHSKPWLS